MKQAPFFLLLISLNLHSSSFEHDSQAGRCIGAAWGVALSGAIFLSINHQLNQGLPARSQ